MTTQGIIELEENDVLDLTVSNNLRFKLLLIMDKNRQYETLKRLMDIYRLSGIKKLEKFFIQICIFDNGQIDLYLKQEMLYILSSKKTTNKIKLSFSNVLFLMLKKAFNSGEVWIMLEENLILYNTIFKDVSIHNLIKNIVVIGIKSNVPFEKMFSLLNKFRNESYFMELCALFFNTRKNKQTRVKDDLILLQILFDKENCFMDSLFHIADNKFIDLGLKLEACDILYLKGSENVKEKVRIILKNILPDLAYTNNPENVHLSSVVASVDKTLTALLEKNKGKKAPLNLFELLCKKFDTVKIKGSLSRIFNYNFLKFSKHQLTLKEIMEQIYICMIECNHKDQLFIRLGEELTEMYDSPCSQGYVTRLINVFSGFEVDGSFNLGITISYEDEIYAIFSNKVNDMVMNAPLSIKEQLLIELMVPSNDYENRLNLIRYLRPYLPKIWNEIFEIFKDELTITDLDLYCRKVTMRYEGC